MGYVARLPRVTVQDLWLRGTTDCSTGGQGGCPGSLPQHCRLCFAAAPVLCQASGVGRLGGCKFVPCQGEAVKRVATARIETPIRQNCQPRPPAAGNDPQRPGWDPRSGATVRAGCLAGVSPAPSFAQTPQIPQGLLPGEPRVGPWETSCNTGKLGVHLRFSLTPL